MIGCELIGGLGNMMFQIATMESMGKDHGLQVCYMNVNSHLQDMSAHERTKTYNPLEYLNIFENFHWNDKISHNLTTFIEVPFAYVPLTPKDGECYRGYFQSEKYFVHNRDFILNLFKYSNTLNEQINKYSISDNSCSIHVRRGDYLRYKNVHFVQKIDYFKKAAEKINANKYFIFSDDIDWCKENFTSNIYFQDKDLQFIENEKDYVELFLMSKCTYNIVSNSSFSWWGAWLNQNPNKIVIAPKHWWAGFDDDVVPNSWIKM
jgi:hypothetical protein